MDSLDMEVLQRARSWLAEGRRAMLVTVVRTWGSSPRPPGALLALREDGRAVGSVSGGCIEDDLMARLRSQGMPARSQCVSYGMGAEEASLRPALRRHHGAGARAARLAGPLDALLERLAAGELVERRLHLASGRSTLATAHPEQVPGFDGETLVSVFGPRYRLLLIGAGQLSACLARIAVDLDFAVTVCDPREEWREEWRQPGAVLTREMPDDVVIAMRPDARSAVIALTHDPKLDDLALMEALRSPAFYVAALGSRHNNAARRAAARVRSRRRPGGRAASGGALHRQSHAGRDRGIDRRRAGGGKERRRPERVLPVAEAKAALEIAADTLSACRST